MQRTAAPQQHQGSCCLVQYELAHKAIDKPLPARIVLEAIQGMLLRLALQMDRENHETRKIRLLQGMELAKRFGSFLCRPADTTTHERIVMLRSKGLSCSFDETIKLARCSAGQVRSNAHALCTTLLKTSTNGGIRA